MAGGKSKSAGPNRRWRGSSASQRRQLIVEAAISLLQRRGLGDVTVRRVAQRLGVGAMTLYTYVSGQEDLRRAMTQRGFEMLEAACERASTLGTSKGWWGGARQYVQFAIDHPNLYDLMFATPMEDDPAQSEILAGGFEILLEKVRGRLAELGQPRANREREARQRAGRMWVALHGLASLAIAGRLAVLGGDIDSLLADILERVSPD